MIFAVEPSDLQISTVKTRFLDGVMAPAVYLQTQRVKRTVKEHGVYLRGPYKTRNPLRTCRGCGCGMVLLLDQGTDKTLVPFFEHTGTV